MTCSVLLLHRYPETKQTSCTTTVIQGPYSFSLSARCNYDKALFLCSTSHLLLAPPISDPNCSEGRFVPRRRTIIPPCIRSVSTRPFLTLHLFLQHFLLSATAAASASLIGAGDNGGAQHTVCNGDLYPLIEKFSFEPGESCFFSHHTFIIQAIRSKNWHWHLVLIEGEKHLEPSFCSLSPFLVLVLV